MSTIGYLCISWSLERIMEFVDPLHFALIVEAL